MTHPVIAELPHTATQPKRHAVIAGQAPCKMRDDALDHRDLNTAGSPARKKPAQRQKAVSEKREWTKRRVGEGTGVRQVQVRGT